MIGFSHDASLKVDSSTTAKLRPQGPGGTCSVSRGPSSAVRCFGASIEQYMGLFL